MDNTCGLCRHCITPSEYNRQSNKGDRKDVSMGVMGFMVCVVKQHSEEDRARYISPHRKACSDFSEKQPAAALT